MENDDDFTDWVEQLHKERLVSDGEKWEQAIQDFHEKLNAVLHDGDYGGTRVFDQKHNGFAINVGIEIHVVHQEAVRKIVEKYLPQYEKYGDIEIRYTPCEYSMKHLNRVCNDLKAQSFFHNKISAEPDAPPIIGYIVAAEGRVRVWINAEFPELVAFLETYPDRGCVDVGGPEGGIPNA